MFTQCPTRRKHPLPTNPAYTNWTRNTRKGRIFVSFEFQTRSQSYSIGDVENVGLAFPSSPRSPSGSCAPCEASSRAQGGSCSAPGCPRAQGGRAREHSLVHFGEGLRQPFPTMEQAICPGARPSCCSCSCSKRSPVSNWGLDWAFQSCLSDLLYPKC